MDNWISVDDRLPSNDDDVLVFPAPNNETGVITASYNPWGGQYGKKWMYCEYASNYGDEYYEATVTHWQPLPEPPKRQG